MPEAAELGSRTRNRLNEDYETRCCYHIVDGRQSVYCE